MGIHSVQPGVLRETKAPESPGAPKKPDSEKSGSPSIRQRDPVALGARSAATPAVPAHSEPRMQVRVDPQAVDEALGPTAELVKHIDADRLPGFYKHASMMLNSSVSDKPFLMDCLAKLYLSAPSHQHPKAADPDWIDDQDVLWGDELLFLFEVSQQVDKLSSRGKTYFSDALASRTDVVRPESGSITELERILLNAKHHADAQVR